jgi:cytochrome c-type biogenesis protein CcmH
MVDDLARRLEQDPSDGDSWLLLARSYKHLNRIEDAVSAYARASALGRTDSELETLGNDDSAATSAAAQIYGNVSLSPSAMELVRSSDTVFVFAKAVGGPGMPAAVLRRPASDLPLDFLLNDSQSMVDGVKLSDFDEVIVTARITRSGDAKVALQGLEAKSSPIAVTDNRHITLIIE